VGLVGLRRRSSVATEVGGQDRCRAPGLGEVRFAGQILPGAAKVVYDLAVKRVVRTKLALGICEGTVSVDGQPFYRIKDLKVGLAKVDATPVA